MASQRHERSPVTEPFEMTTLDFHDVRAVTPGLFWEDCLPEVGIPAETGLFVWLSLAGNLLYVGSGIDEGGLRTQYDTFYHRRLDAEPLSTDQRRLHYPAVTAALAEHDTVAYFAVTPRAVETEAMLLAYSILLTGFAPPLNGHAWDWTPELREAYSAALAAHEARRAPDAGLPADQ